MNFKSINEFVFDENKEKIGFFFKSNVQSSEAAYQRLCDTLVSTGVANGYPSVIYKDNSGLSVFIYECGFDMPSFFHTANFAVQMGIAQVGAIIELQPLFVKKK